MISFNFFKNGKLLSSDTSKDFIKTNQNKVLFILHGLYGRGKNWHTFAKKYSSDRDQLVITTNLRNHGGNEFKKEQSYLLMAEDIMAIPTSFAFGENSLSWFRQTTSVRILANLLFLLVLRVIIL